MVANNASRKAIKPRSPDIDLWQVVRRMVNDVDKPIPQNKEFFGTVRRVLQKSFSCFYGDETQEKLRLQGNLPTAPKSAPTYALVEVPYFTSKQPENYDTYGLAQSDAFWKIIHSEDWKYNFLTVDISGLGQKAATSKGFHIIFTFDEDFKNPKFVRMPNDKDDRTFPKAVAKPKPKPKPKKVASVSPPPRVPSPPAQPGRRKMGK